MQWKLFATLAETANTTTVSIDDDVATVGDALEALLDAEPALTADVLADGEIRDHLRLLVDGRDPFRDGAGLAEPVEADAELALFPPVSGG